MKTAWGLVVVGVEAVVLLASARGAEAACPGAPLQLRTGGAFLVSNPDWRGAGGDQTCGYDGCYQSESGPPVSSDILGVFWSLGTGNPAFFAGDDNGGWFSVDWIKHVSVQASELYYYPAWLTRLDGPNYAPGTPPSWSEAADGCVLNQGPTHGYDGTECTAVLLSDAWNGVGVFTLLTDGILGGFDLTPRTVDAFGFPTIRLQAIPRPSVSGVVFEPDSSRIIQVHVARPTDGVQEDPSCAPAIVGFRVWAFLAEPGSAEPEDRSPLSGWILPPRADGSPQQATALDTSVAIRVFPGTRDVHVAAQLVFDSGFTTAVLSAGTAVQMDDADGDGLSDQLEVSLGTDPGDPDSDGDELLDGFELRYGFDPLRPGDGTQDPDLDGLDNLGEQAAETDPRDPDSDDDALSDGGEIDAGADPRDPDSDDDGLSDGEEVHTHGTSPIDKDTDGGGVYDADEIHRDGTDPLDPADDLRLGFGMVMDTAFDRAVIFDADRLTAVGSVGVGAGAVTGDCVISADGRRGFATDFSRRVWIVDLEAGSPQLAPGTNPIAISNPGEDLALSPDGRFLVVCDGTSAWPVSVVDVASRVERMTFPLGHDCNSVEICRDGSVLVSSTGTDTVRRLIIDSTGNLTDTGEFLYVSNPNNVYCAPDAASGVVVGVSPSRVFSFRTYGMALVSARSFASDGATSGAIARDGRRVYVRTGAGRLYAIDYDPNEAFLSASAAYTRNVAPVNSYYGIEQLTLDPSQTRLYVPEPGRLSVFDAATGEALPGIVAPDLVEPTGVCARSIRDRDGDGLADEEELALGTDLDDPDTDGDGLLDGFEARHGFDPLAPLEGDQDPDGDGLVNSSEQEIGTNPNEPDSDHDGRDDGSEVASGTNPRDPDSDDDRWRDGIDNCPRHANPEQRDEIHTNGTGDACDDPDGDGVFDSTDNCPDRSNAAQTDADFDGLGDECDPCPLDPGNDPDADGLCTLHDNCPDTTNPEQTDQDGDGVGDGCDSCPGIANPDQNEWVACIEVAADGGTCLESRIALLGSPAGGTVTIAQDLGVPVTGLVPLVEVPFADSELPPRIDISSLGDGPYLLCVSTDPAPEVLYGASREGELVTLDLETGTDTPVGQLPIGTTEIEYDPVSWRAFAQAPEGDSYGLEFDARTGAAIGDLVLNSGSYTGLEWVDGRLYGTMIGEGGLPELRILDPFSGNSSLVGDTRTGPLAGLAYHEPSGVLYGIRETSGLFTINLETGAATFVGYTGFEAGSLEFGPDGALYGGGTGYYGGHLFRINRSTGSPTLVGRTGLSSLTGLMLYQAGNRDCRSFVKHGERELTINTPCGSAPTAVIHGGNSTAECTSPAGASVRLDGSASSDPDSTPGTQDDIASLEWFEDHALPSEVRLGSGLVLTVTLATGDHSITLIATDRSGNTDTATVLVGVVDTTAPNLAVNLDPVLLEPPNHRLVDVHAGVSVHDVCSDVVLSLLSVVSNEADDAPGSGDGLTTGDIRGVEAGTADLEFQLRAERQGGGAGRVYTVSYRAVDGLGNAVEQTSLVVVPHDRGGVTDPLEIVMSKAGGEVTIEWSVVPEATSYNVIRGELANLRHIQEAVELGPVTCLAARTEGTQASDAQDPPLVGLAHFYLVEYDDGARHSSYGSESTGRETVAQDVCW